VSLVIMARGVLGLRMKETAPGCARLLRMYWTADKGWSPSLRVSLGDNKSLTLKSKLIAKGHKEPRNGTDSLDKRRKLGKIGMRFSTWNLRSLYWADWLMTVAKELSECKLDLVGVHDVK
jgi:hypothetical protein